MFCLCSGNRFFHFSLFPRVIDGCLPFILYIIITGLLLVLHPSLFIQSLSKNYRFFQAPVFQRESVCKGKAFCFNLQIFFESFFLKKFFRRFSEGVRLTLSRSLAHLQGKILGAATGTLFRSPSFTQSVIFSGSPSRKRLQRYRLFSFPQLLRHTFLQSFFRVLANTLIYFMLWSMIFVDIRKWI